MQYDEQDDNGVTVLNERIQKDDSGALLRSLLGDLATAEDQIGASLDGGIGEVEAGVLTGLLESVRQSRTALIDVWEALHQRQAPVT